MNVNDRPLSPHLQVYKPQITTVLSITHRITGVGLALGALLFAWGLIAVMAGQEHYAAFYAFCKSGIGQFMLFFWLLAYVYHFLNGLRHLFWDTGRGFDMKLVRKTGVAIVALSLIVTALLWVMMECLS